MKSRCFGAVLVGGVLLTACAKLPALVPGGQSQVSIAAPQSASTRYLILQSEADCPPPGECCVAITGTSNLTVEGEAYNFEINTAANGANGIGRVNFTDTAGTSNPNDDTHAQWPIIRTNCIVENGALVGATVEVDFDDDAVADCTFTLRGTPPGGSNSHLSVRSLAADKVVDGATPFPDFAATDVDQRSNQDMFPDDECDGVPNPGV